MPRNTVLPPQFCATELLAIVALARQVVRAESTIPANGQESGRRIRIITGGAVLSGQG